MILGQSPDERFRIRMAALGMDPASEWCHICTPNTFTNNQAELTIVTPREVRSAVLSGPALAKWNGYGFELFGRRARLSETAEIAVIFSIWHPNPNSPYVALAPGQGNNPPLIAEIWQLRAWRDDPIYYAELQWHPENGWLTPAVRGPWASSASMSVKDARNATRLLQRLPILSGPGRPKGSIEQDPDPDFPKNYADAYWKLRELHRRRPQQAEIAAELGFDKSTLSRRKQRYPVPKNPPRTDAPE